MNSKTTAFISLLFILCLVAGVILGYWWPELMLSTSFIGNLFFGALALIAIFIIITGIPTAISKLGDYKKSGRLVRKIFIYFILLGIVAAIVGLVTAIIIKPGQEVTLTDELDAYKPLITGDAHRYFSLFFPDNVIRAIGEGQYTILIFISLVFGIALTTLINKGATVVNFFKEINQALLKLIRYLYYFAPLGLLSLVGTMIASHEHDLYLVRGNLGNYALTIGVAAVIYGVIILPLTLKLFSRRSISGFIGQTLPATLTALGTSSSSMSLPVTYETVTTGNGIDERSGSLVVPLGTVFNIGATAMITIITALFLTQTIGISLSFLQMFLIVLGALVLSLGTAGLPLMTGSILVVIFTMASLSEIKYPGFGLIMFIDLLIIDRLRAALNVFGDAVGAAVIAETFEMKTAPSRTVKTDRKTISRVSVKERRKSYERQPAKRDSRTSRPVKPRTYESKKRVPSVSRSKHPSRGEGLSKQKKTHQQQPDFSKTPERSPFNISETGTFGHDIESAISIQSKKEILTTPVDKLSKTAPHKKKSILPDTPSRSPYKPKRVGFEAKQKREPKKIAITDDTIKRERAKVAAQLAAMREKEIKVHKSGPKETDNPDNTPAFDRESSENMGGKIPTGYPKPDFVPENKQPEIERVEKEKTEIPVPEKSGSLTEDDYNLTAKHSDSNSQREDDEFKSKDGKSEPINEDTDQPPLEFGRRPSRKNVIVKTDDAPHDETENPAEKEKEFSSENMSFGRSKRKKTR